MRRAIWLSAVLVMMAACPSGVLRSSSDGGGSDGATSAPVADGGVSESPAALAVSTPPLPDGVVGVAYAATLIATGGAPPYSWSLLDGNLPGGLALDPSMGAISGTPAAEETAQFTAQVADASGVLATQAFSIRVTSTTALGAVVALTSSKNPSVKGEVIELAVTVSTASGAGTPTGKVEWYDGATLASSDTLSAGKASWWTPNLATGSHPLTAKYVGDGTFAPATSPVLTQVVTAPKTDGSVAPKLDGSAPPKLDSGTIIPPPITGSHWGHIRVFSFGSRSIGYIGDATKRSAAWDWFAAHVDMAEGHAKDLKPRNPSIKTFAYKLDLSACEHVNCSYSAAVDPEPDSLPEDYFLHYSEATQVQYVSLSGTVVATINVPGCPTGQPASKTCRARAYTWTDSRVVFNQASTGFRTWMGNRLVAAAGSVDDGIFLDEHGPGLANTFSLNYQTKIVSGGGLREYGGQTISAAASQYLTDLSAALASHAGKLTAAGKFQMINTAAYATKDSCIQQAVAAKGVSTEKLFFPDWFDGAASFGKLMTLVQQVAAAGGVVDLYGSGCYYGPSGYTAGNYASSAARFFMWRLAGYYLLKEPAGGPGNVYFDPNFCINSSAANVLDFTKEWQPAYEVDVGQPAAAAVTYKTGTAGCNYTIFKRDYTKMLVLVRPKDGWNCKDYGDTSAATVTLPSPMKLLRADGTLSAPMSSVQVRNAEAVILFK